MNNFKGYSLNPTDAMHYIKTMIDVSIVLCASTDEEVSQTGDQILFLARNYAEAVCINWPKPAPVLWKIRNEDE